LGGTYTSTVVDDPVSRRRSRSCTDRRHRESREGVMVTSVRIGIVGSVTTKGGGA
jgi:hypothetical protein